MQGKARRGEAVQHQGNTRARTGGKARNATRERPQEGREKEIQNRWPTIEGLFGFTRDRSDIRELRVFFGGEIKRGKLIGRKKVVLYTPDKFGETIGKFNNF